MLSRHWGRYQYLIPRIPKSPWESMHPHRIALQIEYSQLRSLLSGISELLLYYSSCQLVVKAKNTYLFQQRAVNTFRRIIVDYILFHFLEPPSLTFPLNSFKQIRTNPNESHINEKNDGSVPSPRYRSRELKEINSFQERQML